jgi:hypothetical protein
VLGEYPYRCMFHFKQVGRRMDERRVCVIDPSDCNFGTV